MDLFLINKKVLDQLKNASKIYNNERLHRDFQADEVYKFIDWLYRQYGYENTEE